MRAVAFAFLMLVSMPGRSAIAAPAPDKHGQVDFFSLQVRSAKHAKVELLSLQSKVDSGATILVGVHFVLDKGWHIYWVNPGDSGQPPSFQWHLPPGFAAGAIQWPQPGRMQSSPQLADYGYHDDVLLMVPIQAPRDLEMDGQGYGFSVDAKWLICSEICLSDRATLRGQWGLGDKDQTPPATKALFARAQELLPKPLPAGWKVSAESGKNSFVLSLGASKRPVGKPQFFPRDPGQIENASPQQVAATARGVRITLRKSEQLLKPIAVLRGVLVFPGDKAYLIEAPVRPAKE